MVELVRNAKRRRSSWWTTLVAYVAVTKPASVLLLVFTALGGIVVAGGAGWPMRFWLLALSAITAGCAGANTLTCYIDRDIDGLMDRTKGRPLPQGRIEPPKRALIWGLCLVIISLALAAALNLLSFVWMALGLFDNVVIYSLWSKRRTPLNVMLGAVSGGLPALFGWTAVRGSVSWTPVLLALLVVLWTPNHIWNLAIRYREEYARAGVPMLPVIYDLRRTITWIALSVGLMFAVSLALYLSGDFGFLYLSVALTAGFIVVAGHLHLLARPTVRKAWWLFKFSSLYLASLFLAMILDTLI